MSLSFTDDGSQGSLSIGGVISLLFNKQGLTTTPITTRQTVELGTVDSSGFPAFGGSTGSTTVTTATTLYLNAANGMVNRRGSITNPSWTGLSTNGTMYAYLDIAADGTCTTGSTTLAPTYRFGGADVVTSGQFTFNTQEMTGKVGNGSTAAQTYRVFVGEVTVAGNVVTAIVWYALMGRYDSGYINTIIGAGSAVSKNHNIGIKPIDVNVIIKNLTTEAGYAVNDEVDTFVSYTGAGGYSFPPVKIRSALTCGYSTENTGILLTPKAGGSGIALTAANWAYRIVAKRGW